MSLTDKIIALCPSDVFRNDLDKQTLALCLQISAFVRRYKGNPCVPQDTRMTLEEHLHDLIQRFAGMPDTKSILATNEKNTAAYQFVIQGFRTLLRHDLGETIFEPQTYLQMIDPALPKINTAPFETAVMQSIYHLAQHAVATGEQDIFLARVRALQQEYASFDVEASLRIGQDYADFLRLSFEQALDSLDQLKSTLSPLPDENLTALIHYNDAQHIRDHQLSEHPDFIAASPAGVFAKILDTAQLEDVHYEACKLQNRALPYQYLNWQASNYIVQLSNRSEKLLPLFGEMAAQEKYLQPFLATAYDVTYTRLAAIALVLRPYTFLTAQPPADEPNLTGTAEAHQLYNAEKAATIAARRRQCHALDDKHLVSNVEIAAKALCYRQLMPPVHKTMLMDDVPQDHRFRALFDQTLLELQADTTTAAKVKRVQDICHGRLAFYQ